HAAHATALVVQSSCMAASTPQPIRSPEACFTSRGSRKIPRSGTTPMKDSFQTHGTFTVGKSTYSLARLSALSKRVDLAKIPYSIQVLLENLLRREDGVVVTKADIEAVLDWKAQAGKREIQFMPARVLMQDFTGVPAVVDLAAMRDAMKRLGGDPKKINPLVPVELVIDHSVQVDVFASPTAFAENERLEFERNRERYQFLRWGQSAFRDFEVVP